MKKSKEKVIQIAAGGYVLYVLTDKGNIYEGNSDGWKRLPHLPGQKPAEDEE